MIDKNFTKYIDENEENFLKFIIRKAGVGTWVRDNVNDLARLDKNMIDLWGMEKFWKPGDWIPFTKEMLPMISGISDNDLNKLVGVFSGKDSDDLFSIEHDINRPDATVKRTEVRIEVHSRNEDGLPLAITGVNIDITEKTAGKNEILFLKERMELAIEGNRDAVWDWDLSTKELYVTPRWRDIVGYGREETIDEIKTWRKLIHPDDLDGVLRDIINNIKGKTEYLDNIHRLKHRDGHWLWVQLRGKTLYNENNKAIRMTGTNRDITKDIKLQKELEKTTYNLQQYLDAIDKIEIGLFVVDDDFTIRYMNNTMIEWFGDQQNKTCYSSVVGLNEPCSYCKLHEVIFENKKVTYEPITPTGQSFDIVATSIKNDDGTVSKMEVIRNVTNEKIVKQKLFEQSKKLKHQAHHDNLTGLPNRTFFNDRLEHAIIKAKRNNTKVALFFIDLDHFKEINDTLGHNVGDDVLKKVTSRLDKVIRKEDTLSRLGGDEFTVIMENLTQAQNASLLAQKILENLKKPISIKGHELYISSSIGISIYPDDGITTQNLLKFADTAMYAAKDEGRDNFQFYNSDMTELAFERVVMEASLRSAIKDEDFLIYYQPQVNGETDKLIGMEALVRWKHPTMGIVSPAKFIPLAETTGLIVELDRFVMKTAMTQMAMWYAKGYNPGVLAMNLAVKQFQQKDFIPVFKSLMKETGCKPQWLELEVTEGQIMDNPEEGIKILTKISNIGIELAVDDFGTGYSSLAYLKKLPIDKLKIDQSFVRNLPEDEDDVAIAKAVIALGKSLNLKLIAEGVENKEQKDFLIKNGCQNIQGYYYSKPIPADELEVFLLKNR